MEQPAYRDRPTIEERAAKREQIHTGGNDRYSSLIDALSRGHQLPPEGARPKLTWHPILWTMLRVGLVVIVAYMAALYGWRWWRQQQTDTWTGPTASVQSGQRLAGCAAANSRDDDAQPTWIRFQGVVYVESDSVNPVFNQGVEGQTGFIETGYSLSQLRIILRSRARRHATPAHPGASPPGIAASVYQPDPTCI